MTIFQVRITIRWHRLMWGTLLHKQLTTHNKCAVVAHWKNWTTETQAIKMVPKWGGTPVTRQLVSESKTEPSWVSLACWQWLAELPSLFWACAWLKHKPCSLFQKSETNYGVGLLLKTGLIVCPHACRCAHVRYAYVQLCSIKPWILSMVFQRLVPCRS